MKSVNFIRMSLRDRDLWEGLKQGWGGEMFVHCGAERVWGALWEDVGGTGRGLPEGYGNEAPGMEEKPREGPPSHIGLRSLWEEPLLASGPSGDSGGKLSFATVDPAVSEAPALSWGDFEPITHLISCAFTNKSLSKGASSATKGLRAVITYPQKTHTLCMISGGYSPQAACPWIPDWEPWSKEYWFTPIANFCLAE